MLFKATDACLLVRWWCRCIILSFNIASFISIDLLILAIFISDFWDKILLCGFIWLVMILAGRVFSDTCLIPACPKQILNDYLVA